MTDSNEKILSTEAEDDLLNDDHDPKEKVPTTDHQDPMYTMMQNVNKTLGTLTGSLVAMNDQGPQAASFQQHRRSTRP